MNTEQQFTYYYNQTSPAALTRRNLPVAKLEKFGQGFNDAIDLSEAMVAEDEASPLNVQTWAYAVQKLISLILAFDVPLPLMLPLQNGGIGAEWHESGLILSCVSAAPTKFMWFWKTHEV